MCMISHVVSASPQGKHHAVLLQLLARELGIKPEDIVDFELNLCDVQPGTIGGELLLDQHLVFKMPRHHNMHDAVVSTMHSRGCGCQMTKAAP